MITLLSQHINFELCPCSINHRKAAPLARPYYRRALLAQALTRLFCVVCGSWSWTTLLPGVVRLSTVVSNSSDARPHAKIVQGVPSRGQPEELSWSPAASTTKPAHVYGWNWPGRYELAQDQVGSIWYTPLQCAYARLTHPVQFKLQSDPVRPVPHVQWGSSPYHGHRTRGPAATAAGRMLICGAFFFFRRLRTLSTGLPADSAKKSLVQACSPLPS